MAQEKVPVGIARGESVGDSLQRAVELAAGLDFIQAGETVLIKPNVNSADPYPGTTNPELVYELVRMVWQRDPKRVIVGDRCGFWGATIDFMKRVGIYDAALEAKAEIIPFDDDPWVEVHPEGAVHWEQGFSIPLLVGGVDHIISVPVAKTHRFATFTMSLKNWVGLIPPKDRLEILHTQNHAEPRFGSLIAELNLAIKPSLIVMDATRSFVRDGPESGDMVEPNLIIASPDRIANDVTGLALLRVLGTTEAIMGKSVWEQPQIKRAVELGLGVKSSAEISLRGYGAPELEEIQKHVSE